MMWDWRARLARFRVEFETRLWFRRAVLFASFCLTPLVVYPWSFVRNGLLDGGDDALSNLPMLLHSARALLKFDIFWTPSLWLGTQLLEEPEFATFYLPRLVLLVLPPVTAFGVYVLAHYVLAQIGIYAYARSLELSRGAAVFGAFVYAFSGFMLGHRGHTMYLVAGAWAPLFFTFLRRLELGKGRFNGLGAALCFAALPLSGALQLTAYLVLAAVLLQSIQAVSTHRFEPLIALAVALVPGSLIGALQILPSIGLSSELVDLPGDRYAFSTLLSFDPRHLPLLLTPLDPLASAELYSRVGSVALVFACLGWLRRREPIVRGWLVVAASALLLMLGHHVPVLPKLLDSLPVVSVFRGPVRHNFELGLAMSILAAFGFDAVFARASRVWRIFPGLAAAVVAVTSARGLGELAVRARVSLPDARSMAHAADSSALWAGAAFLGVGIVAVSLAKTRAAAVVAVFVLAAPLVDARYSLGRLDRVWPDWSRKLAIADVRSGGTYDARVLSPPMSVAGPDALAANTALAIPSLHSFLGYASRANKEAALLLDLDMHGHARQPGDLAWSRLPATFGVEFVILPKAECPKLDFGVAATPADLPCGEGDAPLDAPLGPSVIRCHEPLTEGKTRFRLEARHVRDDVPVPIRVELSGRGPDSHVESFDLVGHFQSLSLAGRVVPPHGFLTAAPIQPSDVRMTELALAADTLESVAELDAKSAKRPFDAANERAAIELSSSDSVAHAERWFDWPSWLKPNPKRRSNAPEMELDVIARAAERPAKALFVDLYADATFDPVSGQMAVDPAQFSPYFSLARKSIQIPDPPQHVALRALHEGQGAVTIEQARFLAERRRRVVSLWGRRDATGESFHIDRDIAIGAMGLAKVEYHLPTRPVTVELDVDANPDASGSVAFGVQADPSMPTTVSWQRSVSPGAESSGRHVFTADVPLTAQALVPFVSYHGAGNVKLRKLAVRDACSQRSLRAVGTLESGWTVYRDANALPRVFTVGEVRRVHTLEEARDVLRDDAAFDPRRTALLFEGDPVPNDLAAGRIDGAEFRAQSLSLRVHADLAPTLVVINDRFHDRWRATLDGAPARIYRANGLVRAVVVPAGSHVLSMHYEPPWTVATGAGAAVLGLILALSSRRVERKAATLPLASREREKNGEPESDD
jgi:hypothetical protein